MFRGIQSRGRAAVLGGEPAFWRACLWMATEPLEAGSPAGAPAYMLAPFLFTGVLSAQTCTFTLSAAPQSFPISGGTGTVTIVASSNTLRQNGCFERKLDHDQFRPDRQRERVGRLRRGGE